MKKRNSSLPSLIATLLFVIIVWCFKTFNVLINFSDSIPYGVYVKSNTAIKTGDYVALCLDETNQKIGLDRKYLHKGNICDGSKPLMKEVIALPNENVTLTKDYIQVNNQPRIELPVLAHDYQKRILTAYPSGKYQNNCYWLIGNNNKKYSWDSRYWGCIPSNQILYKIKPIISWK